MPADRDGRLTGGDAVKFFERSGLPRDLLAKVWANSDNKRQGFLDFHAFVRALELVSLAQVGALRAVGQRGVSAAVGGKAVDDSAQRPPEAARDGGKFVRQAVAWRGLVGGVAFRQRVG